MVLSLLKELSTAGAPGASLVGPFHSPYREQGVTNVGTRVASSTF